MINFFAIGFSQRTEKIKNNGAKALWIWFIFYYPSVKTDGN